MDYKQLISELLSTHTNISSCEIQNMIECPPDFAMGDFAFPCFVLAKEWKKSPASIAVDLSEKIICPDFLSNVKATGPYLNFFLEKANFAREVLNQIFFEGAKYGQSTVGTDKTIVLDYSSPNIAKQFHIGHLYTTVIGNALYKIFQALGYHTVGINYLGDWGTQFGKMIVAYKKWGNEASVISDGVEELNRIYVRFHEEADKNPSLNDDARSWLVKMQNGDQEALALWKWFREISLNSYNKTYKRLHIMFDSFRGESYYNDKMSAVVDELQQKDLLLKSDGAMIVDLEPYKMPPCLILRTDGGTLYPTRDIAAAFDRKQTYNFYKSIYVTDLRQSMHFAQFFKVIELMGYEWAKDMIHVPYGLLSLESGSLSTRSGNVVLLEDLFNEASSRSLSIINEKNPTLTNKEDVAEQVGIGAIIFAALFNSRIKDVVFSWERILSFDGETAPYVQYSYARCASLLRKAGETKFDNVDFSLLTDDLSFTLLRLLHDFPNRILEASEKLEPFIISRWLVETAKALNRFYHTNIVLCPEEEIRKARLYLVFCSKQAIFNGLALLGIQAPEEM